MGWTRYSRRVCECMRYEVVDAGTKILRHYIGDNEYTQS